MKEKFIMNLNECPICQDKTSISPESNISAYYVNCPHCGKYYIEENMCEYVCRSLKEKSCLSFFLSQNNQNSKLIPHFYDDPSWEDGIIKNRHLLSIKNLMNSYPINISNKIDMTLLNIQARIKYMGNTFTIYSSKEDKKLYPEFFVDDTYGADSLNTQFNEFISTLKELGMIKHVRSLGDNKNTYTITTKGWGRVQELQANHTQSTKAFIAMWFDDTIVEARQAIINAITECGYSQMIIDVKEHNNQIVPEIFYEIKQSCFVVADLTGQRTGVYYEAGYAEALNKQVILTCKTDDFNKRHFDVSQKNTIQWANAEDLYKRLVNRIEATVGRRK